MPKRATRQPATTTAGAAAPAASPSRTGGLPDASRCASAWASRPGDVMLARVNDSLMMRTQDGLDRLVLEGYLGLIPDASTLRIIFSDGHEWSGAELLARIGSWLTESESTQGDPGSSAPNH